jgi:hypothetical protein
MKHLISDDDGDAVTVPLTKTPGLASRAMWNEIFGGAMKKDAKMEDVKLPIHPGKKLDATKITSLAKKYHSIPEEYKE